ncbi:MAG: glyoxylate/hydroxypyruvate reductase A [Xanthobacteraceae bacterium]|nr:glyoxylate/hydroxypyruvate reductase A [Xanthobacteraceae bacterium]
MPGSANPHAGAVAIVVSGWDAEAWAQRFRTLAPSRPIWIWPHQIERADEVAYACAWRAPHGSLAELMNLKAIFSLGAGVDHLLGDRLLPAVPIVRIVDPDLTARMVEYVVLHVLIIHRHQRLYDAQQRQRLWRDNDQPSASEVSVGVMGLGHLGSAAAQALRGLGFQVQDWSRTPKSISGVACHSGADGLDAFLAASEILVVLLPHTPATEGMINLALLRKLKHDGALGGAHLINSGRGLLQVDSDILAALDQNLLASATLDVFPQEPLAQESPFWQHPRVTVTPHNAATSDPRFLVRNVLTQIERLERGEPLENTIDRALGY